MDDEQWQFDTDIAESIRELIKARRGKVQRVGTGETVVLQVHKAESGQWSGRVFDGHGVELGGTAGCDSPEDVQRLTVGNGHKLTHIVVFD